MQLDQRPADLRVEISSVTVDKSRIGHLPDETVSKPILRFRHRAFLNQQL